MEEKPSVTTRIEGGESRDPELTQTSSSTSLARIDKGNEAVLLDIDAAGISNSRAKLKLAPDGHTVLVPQPSDDPNDPLNWSTYKKHGILFVVALGGFVCEFSAGVANPAIIVQGPQWGVTPERVIYANNLFVAMMAVGAVIWVPTSYYWGRAPQLFWSMILGTAFLLGSTLSTDFNMYCAFRSLQGLFLTCSQVIGVGVIKDCFFLHEQARKIGLYICLVLLAPNLGPMLAGFMLAGLLEWRPAFWLTFGLAICSIGVLLVFHDETWYRRDGEYAEPSRQPAGLYRRSRMLRLIGVVQLQREFRPYFLTVQQSYLRLLITVFKPVVIPTMLVSALTFMWAVGMVVVSSILFGTPVAEGGYGYGPDGVGYLFFVPLVGIILGYVCGHFFNDWRARHYVRKHNGIYKPEARLVTGYIAAVAMIPALILVGCALQLHLNVGAVIIGWGAYVWGIMVMAVALTAYLCDAYPLASAEISGLVTFSRTISGFSVGYFQTEWGLKVGYIEVFGVEAALCAVGIILLFFLHMYGERLRAWGGPLTF